MTNMKRRIIQFCLLIIFFSFTVVFLRGNPAVSAQSGDMATGWTRHRSMPGSHDEADPPYLVADGTGTVHAFYSQPVPAGGSQWAIVYSKWTHEGIWTEPIDIILPPFSLFALVKGAFIDQDGLMHIIYFGGDDIKANMYYSSAPAAQAGQARAWSKPVIIGEGAKLRVAALAGDKEGNLYVLYTGDPEGIIGLYFVESLDGGASWSEPVPIQLTFDEELFPFAIQTHMDGENRLHAVFVINNQRGIGEELYYTRQEAEQQEWSKPTKLVFAGQYDGRLEDQIIGRVQWPSITNYDDRVIITYIACEPCERWMRYSIDGGVTWSEPQRPFITRGSNGTADFETDSNNVLHIFLGDRARGYNVFHSVWQNGQWAEPEPIAEDSGVKLPDGRFKFVPAFPNAVINLGNEILLTWATDPLDVDRGLWYSRATLNAPEVPPVALPTPTIHVPITPTPVVTQVVAKSTPASNSSSTNVAGNTPNIAGGGEGILNELGPSLLFVLIPSTLLLVGALAISHYLRHRKFRRHMQ